MKSLYYQQIRNQIAKQGKIGIDPRHVESFMRLEHSTLDGLSKTQFNNEVSIGIECTEYDKDGAERCAQSFGL